MKNNLQVEYFNKLKELDFADFPKIRMDKVLFNECIYVQNLKRIKVFKRLLCSLFGMNYCFNYKNVNSKILFLTRIYHRNDHDSYWRSIKKCFPESNEIIIDYLSGKDKLNSFSIKKLLSNIVIYKRYKNALLSIKCKSHRRYLASILTDIFNYKVTYLDEMKLPKIVMVFFDADPLESFTMQYFAQNGCITITNQHGYPIFRPNADDLLNQSQIINLSSQYYLSKGEFTRKQFINAGFEKDRIKIVGSLQEKNDYVPKMKKAFAVFLDTPALDFGIEANRKMVQFALEISKDLQLSFIVKMHPADKNRDVYEKLLSDSKGVIAKATVCNEEMYESIDFALIHASSIYINLVMAGIKMYKLELGYDFPLVESSDDIIRTKEEFVEKYNVWLKKSIEDRKRYIRGLQDYYSFDNAEDNIKRFINEMIKEEMVINNENHKRKD